MSQAAYRLFSAAGQPAENGDADVSVTGGALVLVPASGAALRVPFGQLVSVTEPEPYLVRISFCDGSSLELSRLGVMRTQLLAELRDGTDSVTAGVGVAQRFTAWCGQRPVRIRVYDDCLLVDTGLVDTGLVDTGLVDTGLVDTGLVDTVRIGFSFITEVTARDYAITVDAVGRAPVTLSRLGRQFGQLAELLDQRLREARVRTASFLGSLLPGLGPLQARSAAAALRDGVAVPASELDRIDPALTATLLQLATLPQRKEAVALLARQTGLAIGFKQLATVRRPATGTQPWHDHAAPPHIGAHDGQANTFQPGPAGLLAAEMMSQAGASLAAGASPGSGPDAGAGFGAGPGAGAGFGTGFGAGAGFGYTEGLGAAGDYWALRALGGGLSPAGWNPGAQQRPMSTRPDLSAGSLTPAADDPSALTLTSASAGATVLAFALCAVPGRVIYDVLNQDQPDTYVFVADDQGGLSTLNRALDEAGFRPAQLSQSVSDRIPHDAHWPERIARLLSG